MLKAYIRIEQKECLLRLHDRTQCSAMGTTSETLLRSNLSKDGTRVFTTDLEMLFLNCR